jgi:hypothetical protein
MNSIQVALSLILAAHCAAGQPAMEFGLLFDAGSTGTRLSIFTWPARAFATVPPPMTVPVELYDMSNRSAPGIDRPAGLVEVSALLSWAQATLSNVSSQWSTTPVFLCATAGLRILGAPQRAAVMASVRALLGASPFLFQPEWARVISGEVSVTAIYGSEKAVPICRL